MTEEQVRDVLGSPNSVKTKTVPEIDLDNQIRVFQWAQTLPPRMIEVEFFNGVAGTKTTTLPPAAPSKSGGMTIETPRSNAWAQSRMTRENFDRITNGMTESEVTAILGKPYERWHSTATKQGPTTIMMWIMYEPDLTIKVTFRRGKVAGKNWILIKPKRP
jgi:hypothetical protein